MGTIEEIIQTIDDELIERRKDYLLLGQANQLLESRGVLTSSEKSNKCLKKLLENNKISHAYQTEATPRQWIIPLSEQGIQRKISIKRQRSKPKSKPKITHQDSVQNHCSQVSYTNCPSCGINLTILQNGNNGTYLQCCNCGKNFKNPFVIDRQRQQRGIITLIVIGIFVISFIIGQFGNNDSSSSSNLYYMNTTTWAGTSKDNFDEMISNESSKNMQALISLKHSGQIVPLPFRTEVYLVSTHFGYCIVRPTDSMQNLWIETGKISQK